ncbi:hypothetical protein LUZ60_015348 [Juncus effusus]|nr:hypothetical protein LUZ60_015348 [Juncus effusus]
MLHKPPSFPLSFPPSSSHSASTSLSLSLSRSTTSLHRLSSSPKPTNIPICTTPTPTNSNNAQLLSLLQNRETEQAYTLFSTLTHLPDSRCLSRLLAQLSYNAKSSAVSLARAKALIRKLVSAGELHRLDGNSLGLLASAAATAGNASLAGSVVRAMLRMGILPHVKAWTAAVSSLAGSDSSTDALRIFHSVMKRIREARDADVSISNSSMNLDLANSSPDTTAFNAALNACANLGDIKSFAQIFLEDMIEFKSKPDILTYNVLIKMCARAGRKDLISSTFEKIININLEPCITTYTSLIAAFVGFGDLKTAEMIIQAMREGQTDICQLLRDRNLDNENTSDNNIMLLDVEMNELLENMVGNENVAVPVRELSKIYKPDCRIYTTLMKGYMKAGRLDDVVWTIKAMKLESDPKSRPDHVTYTTVITALVNVGSMDQAHDVFNEMKSANIHANLRTYNVLLKGYCSKLEVNKAKELMREMETQVGIKPSVESYNTLINGCILIDDTASALAFFNEMRDKGIAPSKISYTTIMKAFALSGQPKLAHKVFDEMSKDQRVQMDMPAWNMLVKGYCKMGLLLEAKRVVEQMKEHGFSPDIKTYASLANCIAWVRKPGEALLLWNEVKERCNGSPPFKPDEELLGVLADICVKNAFFKKALEIVACMEENGIPPNKTKYRKIYIEMHSRMFTSKHASQARKDRRRERVRAAEAFKFWLGLPNSYYGTEWSLEPPRGDGNSLA